MKQEILIIEMGKFTGEIGLEVYERFKREVDEWWNKLQGIQIQKSRTIETREGVEKTIITKALDKFLPQLSAKERLEIQTGQKFSDVLFNMLVGMDRDYLKEELKAMCKKADLRVSGDKKELAWRLLKHEVKRTEKQFEIGGLHASHYQRV